MLAAGRAILLFHFLSLIYIQGDYQKQIKKIIHATDAVERTKWKTVYCLTLLKTKGAVILIVGYWIQR